MDAHEIERRSPDQPLLRRTRLRFLGWSAGVTLVALVLVGSAIYAAVAASLADAATDQLRSRATEMGATATMKNRVFQQSGTASRVTSDPARAGVVFGGDSSGTLGIFVESMGAGPFSQSVAAPAPGTEPTRSDIVPGPAGAPEPGALDVGPVDPAGLAAAQNSGTVSINDVVYQGTPVRVLSQ